MAAKNVAHALCNRANMEIHIIQIIDAFAFLYRSESQ